MRRPTSCSFTCRAAFAGLVELGAAHRVTAAAARGEVDAELRRDRLHFRTRERFVHGGAIGVLSRDVAGDRGRQAHSGERRAAAGERRRRRAASRP